MPNYYYSGQGSLYVAERTTAGKAKGFTALGNVPKLEVSVEVTKFEHKESESGSRAVDLTIIQEKKGTFSMTLESLTLDNLSMAFWGTSTINVGAAIPQEDVVAYLDSKCALVYPSVTSVVVKDVTDVTTYVEDTDYTLDAVNGTITPLGTGAIGEGDVLHVGYTYAANTELAAFTESSMERWLRFEGLNTIDNKTVVIDIFKASIDPLQGYGLINEELGSVELAGSMLYDSLQSGTSKYFKQVNVT